MSRILSATETMDRLLAAATEVFADVGYRGATLREICRRARANIAAVNYHFRDKEQLYAAVLEQAFAESQNELAEIVPDPGDPPEERFRHFICKFLGNLLGADRPVQLLRLLAHEMVEPTCSLQLAVDKGARPVNDVLRAIVAELLGPSPDPALVRDCTASVLMQCSSYYHSEAIVERLDHVDVHDPATIEHLADHIFRFSLGGIRAMSGSRAAGTAFEKTCSRRSQ
jgi:TetR/AcrR family transcriptional regulator, regulator of cefoperazone and chloramphenicol sensitivity